MTYSDKIWHITSFFFFGASCSNHCLAALDLGKMLEVA